MSEEPVQNAYHELRELALSITADQIGIAATPERPQAWGAMMEIGFAEGSVTLVALLDRTVSLYLSNGGGIIGGGAHDSVWTPALAFIDATERALGHFALSDVRLLPGAGRVRFFAHTFAGLMTAEASDADVAGGAHPLSALFFAGNAVVAAMQEMESKQGVGRSATP